MSTDIRATPAAPEVATLDDFRAQVKEEASSRYPQTSQDVEFDAFTQGASWAFATCNNATKIREAVKAELDACCEWLRSSDPGCAHPEWRRERAARLYRARWARPATPPAPEVGEVERLRIMVAGIRYGYMAGHDDTVESRYGDPDDVAADYAPEILGELDATFESMLEQQAQPATDQAKELSLADVDELCKEFGFHYADGETWVLGYNDTLAVLREMITAALLKRLSAPASPAPEVVSQPYKLPEPGEVGKLVA